MPNLKSIKRKISSIKNTRQITKAMKMVAGAKLKRSQSAMNEFKAYASAYEAVIKNIRNNSVLHFHPFYGKGSKKGEGGASNAGIIIISTDRGLCGSFNMNLFKLFFEEVKNKGINLSSTRLYILGKKAQDFFKKQPYEIAFSAVFSQNESVFGLSNLLSEAVLNDFNENKIESVNIISNKYLSTFFQKAHSEKLLPFEIKALDGQQQSEQMDASASIYGVPAEPPVQDKNSGGYLIEPADYEEEIIDKIFKNYIQTKIYFKILESFVGEQASRMTAMDNATRNAAKLINKLTMSYNKARQAAVTLEILDIINGANAIK